MGVERVAQQRERVAPEMGHVSKQDWRDWYIMVHVTIFAAAVMGYAFLHPAASTFATACGTLTTVIGMYHWFTQRDDKVPDAGSTS